jgi:hypothetical protein
MTQRRRDAGASAVAPERVADGSSLLISVSALMVIWGPRLML